MSQQDPAETWTPRPARRESYGKLALAVGGLLLPACIGVGFWIGSKSEIPKKTSGKDVSVASASTATRRDRSTASSTATTPTPATPETVPTPPKKVETPPKPVAKKKADPDPEEMPEPKKTEPKPPEKKPDPPEPKKTPEPKPPEPKKTPEPKKGAAPTFASVMPIFQMKCASCHSAASKKGGLDLATLASLMKGGSNGAAVKPGDLDNSNLWTQVEGDSMPPDGKPKLTEAEKRKIQEWIVAGAK